MDHSTLILLYNDKVLDLSGIGDNATVGRLKAEISNTTGIQLSALQITAYCESLTDDASTSCPEDTVDFEVLDLPSSPGGKEDSHKKIKENDGLENTAEKFPEALEKNENATSSNGDAQSDKQRKIEAYKIKEINNMNANKKLLVIRCEEILARVPLQDLWSQGAVMTSGYKRSTVARPHVHEFLSRVSAHYNIVIWSSHGMDELVQKLNEVGIFNNENYKIAFCLDREALLGDGCYSDDTKLLNFIWTQYPAFSSKNTVFVDDADNSETRGQSVLKVRKSHIVRVSRDRELLKLGVYLESIAEKSDFSALIHTKWSENIAIADNKSLEEEELECSNFGSCDILQVTPLVKGKKLLIFNLDQVMFNPMCTDTVRRHFQSFFTSIYEKYDIAVWSRENKFFMNDRDTILRFSSHPAFKISFYLNYRPENLGIVEEIRMKVLTAISHMYPEYSSQNTVIIDRHRFNVNGLVNKSPMKVRFMQLAIYLNWAATETKFSKLQHDHWLNYFNNIKDQQHLPKLKPDLPVTPAEISIGWTLCSKIEKK